MSNIANNANAWTNKRSFWTSRVGRKPRASRSRSFAAAPGSIPGADGADGAPGADGDSVTITTFTDETAFNAATAGPLQLLVLLDA